MAEIILSQRAKVDLDSIYYYVSQDSPIYAKRLVEKILNRIKRIDNSVGTGKKLSELNAENICEVFEGNHRIIYRENSDVSIEVLTILHTARFFDWDRMT